MNKNHPEEKIREALIEQKSNFIVKGYGAV